MRQNKLKNLVFPIIILNLMIFSIYSMGNPPMKNVLIDGEINVDEWADADWKIPFYLNVDNNPDYNGKINVDGYNFLYIGEDSDNLYLALDLCGDRSDNVTGEWVGVWLNTANRVYDNYFDWVEFFDDGVETLLYDIEKNQIWEYFTNTYLLHWYDVNNDSEYVAHYGTIEGNRDNFMYSLNPDFNITSETIGSDELYWLNFSIDMTKWVYMEQELDVIQYIQILTDSRNSVVLNDHKLVLWNSDGSFPSLNDPHQVISLNTLTSYDENVYEYGVGNLTADKKLQFSLIGNNSGPFKTSFNRLHFRFLANYTNWAGHVRVPYSTIANYQIEWSFGPSPNNATDHRMFEFSIPKTELELYDANEELGIIVGGYGTLSYINGSNFWVFSVIDHHQYVEDSTYYNYYDMKGLSESKGVISGYPLILLVGITSICSVVVIKKKFK